MINSLHEHADDKRDQAEDHLAESFRHEALHHDAMEEHEKAKQAAANIAALIGATVNI